MNPDPESPSGAAARYGWSSNFTAFHAAEPRVVRGRLQDFLPDVDASQVRAWDESIPRLQREVGETLDTLPEAAQYSAILEYQLPLEFRRPDVLLLVGSAIIVLELKGKAIPSQADLDQTAACARDLRACQVEPGGGALAGAIERALAEPAGR